MYLENVSLINFKNYQDLRLEFTKGLNCIIGINGSGKTNLLDAIHFLCLTKSAFNNIDSQLIFENEPFFSASTTLYIDSEKFQIKSVLQPPKKKHLSVNKVEYEKMSQHIGRFPVVLIAPNDTDLIREGSELRRKFFDNILSQSDHDYLDKLIQYNHLLKQRNSLLKQFKEAGKTDSVLLETYDKKLIPLNKFISEKRAELTIRFKDFCDKNYQQLSGDREETKLKYVSKVSADNFEELYYRSLDRDIILERTNVGVHKDDYEFTLNDKPLKKFGSQGQQKSFVIALKLAQHEYINEVKSIAPILLLDDIFDKLDDDRIRNLVEMVSKRKDSQIFVTDARPERTQAFLSDISKDFKIFEIEEGRLKKS